MAPDSSKHQGRTNAVQQSVFEPPAAPFIRSVRRFVSGLVFELAAGLCEGALAGPFRLRVFSRKGNASELRQKIEHAYRILAARDNSQAASVLLEIRTIVLMDGWRDRVVPWRKMLILQARVVEGLPAHLLAAQLVSLSTYSRLLREAYAPTEDAPSIECLCRAAELGFLEKVPDTIDIRISLRHEMEAKGCFS